MLDLSSNNASNRKMDRSGGSGMSILGGIGTKPFKIQSYR